MKIYQRLALLGLISVACSHKAHNENNANTNPNLESQAEYQRKLDEVYAADFNSDLQANREPSNTKAQLDLLKTSLGDFKKISSKKFEVYVFPKINAIAAKNNEEKEVVLGKPQVNEVSVVALTECKYMLKGKGFAKYSPAAYFPASLGEGKKSCAIIEVTSRAMIDLNRSLLREGDEITKRLYMDDSYTVHGLETEYYQPSAKQKSKNTVTAGMKFPQGAPSSSAMGYIPVDMPVLAQVAPEKADIRTVFASPKMKTDYRFKPRELPILVDNMAIRQIVRKNKKFRVPECSLQKINYKDYFRNNVEMYWCEGVPWPQVVENVHFVAVTQNLSVR